MKMTKDQWIGLITGEGVVQKVLIYHKYIIVVRVKWFRSQHVSLPLFHHDDTSISICMLGNITPDTPLCITIQNSDVTSSEVETSFSTIQIEAEMQDFVTFRPKVFNNNAVSCSEEVGPVWMKAQPTLSDVRKNIGYILHSEVFSDYKPFLSLSFKITEADSTSPTSY